MSLREAREFLAELQPHHLAIRAGVPDFGDGYEYSDVMLSEVRDAVAEHLESAVEVPRYAEDEARDAAWEALDGLSAPAMWDRFTESRAWREWDNVADLYRESNAGITERALSCLGAICERLADSLMREAIEFAGDDDED